MGVGLLGPGGGSGEGHASWLLVRRSTDDPEDRGYYQAYGPEGTRIEELVRVCQECWAMEECFAEAKGEVGLDHYEVRRCDAWGTVTSLCACSPTPSWSPFAWPPATKNTHESEALKRGT
jgi:hypothetical protein